MTTALIRRPAAIGRGLAVIAGTIGFMVGIPWALVHLVGNPLPTVVPSLDDIRYAITNGQIDQWTMAKGAALAVWLSWAHLAVSLTVEIAAALRGGTAAAVRGLGATQWLAARAVSQFSLVFAMVFQSTISVATAATLPPIPSTVSAPPPTSMILNPQALEVDRDANSPDTEDLGATVEVGRRDTLWGLADQHLGEGQRWEEIRDANVGRTMADGTIPSEGFTSLKAGWTLVIPGLTDSLAASAEFAASGLVDSPTASAEFAAGGLVDSPTASAESAAGGLETGYDSATGDWIIGSWRVEKGDHFWKISEGVLEQAWGRPVTDAEISGYWADVVDANRQHLISPGGDPNLIYPDQHFEILLPPIPADISSPGDGTATTTPYPIEGLDQFTAASAVATGVTETTETLPPEPEPGRAPAPTMLPEAIQVPEPPPDPPVTQASPAVPVESATEPAGSLTPDGVSEGSPIDTETVALGLFGTAVGAGALMAVLRHRRRLQAARRRPNTVIEQTPIMPSEFEHRIRPIGDTEAVRWLASANRYLTHQLAEHPENPLPSVVAMRAGRYGVEILLDQACLPVDGFINGGADGKAWRIHPDLEQRMIERTGGLAHAYSPALLPVGPTDAGDLLLDFEQIGALGVTGDPDTIVGWLRSIAVAVTSSPWAQDCEVVAIGLDADLAAIPQVTAPADPAEWAKRASAIHAATAQRLDASTYENRVNPGELHYPQIVLVGPGHEGIAQYLEETAQLAFSPLAVVAAAPLRSETRIDMQPTLATIEPLGVDFTPATTSTEAIRIAISCLDAAANTVTTPEPAFFDQHQPADADDGEVSAPIGAPPQPAEGTNEPTHPNPAGRPTGATSGLDSRDDVADPSLAPANSEANGTGQPMAAACKPPEPSAGNSDLEANLTPIGDPQTADAFEASSPDGAPHHAETNGHRERDETSTREDPPGIEREHYDNSGPGAAHGGPNEHQTGQHSPDGRCADEHNADEGNADERDIENLSPALEQAHQGLESPEPSGQLAEGAGANGPSAARVGGPGGEVGLGPATSRAIEAIMASRPIEAHLLGRVPTLEGLDQKPQAKIEAVIIYMAFARTIASDRLRSIFWPTSVSRGTSDNAIAKIRRMLGETTDGQARLSVATNTGRFELSDEVGCDWHRVLQLVGLAKTPDCAADELACLHRALSLVTGRPGADASVKLYSWFTDDYEIYTHVETVLVDAAYRLGELAITAGDPAMARWAADQGLLVVPGQEALHRIQMKAASLAGDEQGVEDAYRAATRSAEALSAWEDVQPETDDLYSVLTRRTVTGQAVTPESTSPTTRH